MRTDVVGTDVAHTVAGPTRAFQVPEWSADLLRPETTVDTEEPFTVAAELTRNWPPPTGTPEEIEIQLRLNGTVIASERRLPLSQGETITMETLVDPVFGPVVEGENDVTFTGWEIDDPVLAGRFLASKPPSVVTAVDVAKRRVVQGELFKAVVVHEGRVAQAIVDGTIVFNRVERHPDGTIAAQTTILSDDIQTTPGVNTDEYVLQLLDTGEPEVCCFITDRRVIDFI